MAIEQKDIFQFRSWSDLVQEYSTLQLKYESDRLPALAGIADIVSRIISDQYLSGIWKANLSSGLLWNPAKYPAKLSGIAGVPSWSWASVIGPIKASNITRQHLEANYKARALTKLEEGHSIREPGSINVAWNLISDHHHRHAGVIEIQDL
ncbi:hypothetical protein BHE90_005236 [Fusarium euwallaceae]|uniref:Uncharacterized protein n=1 Tax=Fusarium euwallaceae TaxID=1147111 RepID=A0A430LX27_9HYPO|nr:hypothetical protein BHE90_005236 [Fusarium euwallaceae]